MLSGMQTLITVAFAAGGWCTGYLVGGGHEWGWRGAVLAVLSIGAVALRVRNDPAPTVR